MLHEVCFIRLPECWETCGACADEELEVLEVLVGVGDLLRAFDPVVVLETGKTSIEVPTTQAGQVAAVIVSESDMILPGEALVLLDTEVQTA